MNTENRTKEVFEEPTCELVEFSFENILVQCDSNELDDDLL